jgi:hypothetical protein
MLAPAAFAQDHDHHGPPAPAAAPAATPPAADTDEDAIVGGMSRMTSALGPYGPGRDAGGTAWQPDAAPHMAVVHLMPGDWMVMVHGEFNLVASDQSGPRGDSRSFAAGMLMAMAERDLGPGTAAAAGHGRAPTRFMGPEGYPLLLATGETADGDDPSGRPPAPA